MSRSPTPRGCAEVPAKRRCERVLVSVPNLAGDDRDITEEQKHAMAAELTDVMVKHEGSEAFREVVWVLIEELHPDGWHIGGRPFAGPKALKGTLGRSAQMYSSIDGNPTSRPEFAQVAPAG